MEPRSRTQWARLRRLRDRRIDYRDIPATTPEFWAPAVVIHPSRKVPVSLRLDEHVLAWFKGQGARYQTRINAVLRAYVERHAAERPAVKEPIATYRDSLRADLGAAQERYEALENLRGLISPRILDYAERRIEALADPQQPLKLPVLFFFLIRRDPRQLRHFDEFVGRLRRSHHKRELPSLLDRLRSEEDYRQAASAIFEVDVLRTLLDAAPPGSVTLYPTIGTTRSGADAAVRLGKKTVYVEAKLLSQTAEQERVQGTGLVYTVDFYADARRVIGKLTEKPAQLHPDAPNVICLGLSDHWPDVTSVETAIEAVFRGSRTIFEIPAGEARDAATKETLGRLAREARAEPRLAGVLAFQVTGDGIEPLKPFRNGAANPSNRLEAREWKTLLALFGFPEASGDPGAATPRVAAGR